VNRTGFAILILLVIITRLPFIGAGYGTDPDAWRVAEVGAKLWHTGVYEVSRFPGYPLHEFVTAPLVATGGAPLSNTVTLLCSLLLLFVWHRITLREARHPALLVVILAFTPLFWKNSAATMDYAWSLLFLLLSLDHALRNKALAAGLFLGIAAGFRAGNAAAVIPVLIVMMSAGASWRSMAAFVPSAAAAAIACYVPVAIVLGPGAWIDGCMQQVESIRTHMDVGFAIAGYRAVYAYGPAATLFGLGVLIAHRRRITGAIRDRDPLVAGAVAATVVFGAQFFMLPMEREYLLPLLPFAVLGLDRLVTRGVSGIMGALLISYALVNPDLVEHEGLTGRIHPNVRWGVMIEEWQKHTGRERLRAEILSAHPAQRSLVMTGFPNSFWFGEDRIERVTAPFHEPVYRNTSDSLMHHTLLLSREEVAAARRAGYTVCVIGEARRFVEQAGGYSLSEEKIGTMH
jgi:hypothetical protein